VERFAQVPDLPSIQGFLEPVLRALATMQGAGTTAEIRASVVRLLALEPGVVDRPHGRGRDRRTELEYRLAWARTRLRKQGLVEPDGPRRWRLTDAGWRAVHAPADTRSAEVGKAGSP